MTNVAYIYFLLISQLWMLACGSGQAGESDLAVTSEWSDTYITCEDQRKVTTKCKLREPRSTVFEASDNLEYTVHVHYNFSCDPHSDPYEVSLRLISSGNQSQNFYTATTSTLTFTTREKVVLEDDGDHSQPINRQWFNLSRKFPCELRLQVTATPSDSQIIIWQKEVDVWRANAEKHQKLLTAIKSLSTQGGSNEGQTQKSRLEHILAAIKDKIKVLEDQVTGAAPERAFELSRQIIDYQNLIISLQQVNGEDMQNNATLAQIQKESEDALKEIRTQVLAAKPLREKWLAKIVDEMNVVISLISESLGS